MTHDVPVYETTLDMKDGERIYWLAWCHTQLGQLYHHLDHLGPDAHVVDVLWRHDQEQMDGFVCTIVSQGVQSRVVLEDPFSPQYATNGIMKAQAEVLLGMFRALIHADSLDRRRDET